MFTIQSDRLRLEIAHPGEAPNYTCRFDHAGFVSEIILDGVHRFCASEPNNLVHPSSGGRGLCNEYQFDVSGEAEDDEWFPKFGIGLLRKKGSAPWCFYESYAVRPFPIEIETGEDYAVFHTEPLPCLGYALRCEKTVSVRGNQLEMAIVVENVGEKPIDGREYCHNFLTIDGMALGPGYAVSMPHITDRGEGMLGDMIRGHGKGFTFSAYQPQAELAYLLPEEIHMEDHFSWTMRNTDAGVSIEAKEYFRPVYFQLWAVDHMISVELFHGLRLQPGEKDSWRRTWTFAGEGGGED